MVTTPYHPINGRLTTKENLKHSAPIKVIPSVDPSSMKDACHM